MSLSKTLLLAGTILSAGVATQAQAQPAGSSYTSAQRFDAMGRVTGTISADPDGTGPLPHRATRNTYDLAGRLTRMETGTLATWQSEQVAPASWSGFTVHQMVDSQYDTMDRKTREAVSGYVTPGSGSAVVRAVVQQSYDEVGRLKCSAVRMNPAAFPASGSAAAPLLPGACEVGLADTFGPDRITQNHYDRGGQLTEVHVGLGTTDAAIKVKNTYSPDGQLATLTDGNGNRTTYEFDGFGRPKTTFFPVVAVGESASSTADYEQVTLDANGNVTQRRVRDGQLINMTYDALNRLILKDLPGSEPDVSYAYDLLGKVTSATQPGLALSFTYDGFGRQLTQTSPAGTVGSTWDAGGRRTRITHPGGYYVDQDHLVTGELITIRENGATSGSGVLATYGYDGLGQRTSLTYGNGTSTAYAYDPVGRLASLGHDMAGTAHDLSLTFSYNPASQILLNNRSNKLYSYGSLNSGSVAASHDGLNRVVDTGGPVTHDARGNLTSEGERSFSYSSENLLTGLTALGSSWTLTYDPMRRLQHTTISGTASRTYAYDGDNALMTLQDGQLLARNVFGPGASEPFYTINNEGRRTWFISDERGSVLGGAETDGVTTSTISYGDYGDHGNQSRSAWQYGYTGALTLWAPRIVYMRARFYDPKLGRFLQIDPIGYEGGINLYAYANGDPVNLADPTGTHPVIALAFLCLRLSWCRQAVRSIPRMLSGSSGSTARSGASISAGVRIISSVGVQRTQGTGIEVPGHVLSDSRNDDGRVSPEDRRRGSEPSDAPHGTRPIDDAGIDTDGIHDIKDGIGAGADDYVGIGKDGSIITTDPQTGRARPQGHISDHDVTRDKTRGRPDRRRRDERD